MSKLDRLMKAGYSVAMENIPVVGKVFDVLHRMDDEEKFEGLEAKQIAQGSALDGVFKSINNIEQRLNNLTGSINELRSFNETNDFIMLPSLLRDDQSFREFWHDPSQFGGRREPFAEAQKAESCFSFLMGDMFGDKWVYHIPVYTFGLLLQNQAMKGEATDKAVGYDSQSQTNWITGDTGLLVPHVPERQSLRVDTPKIWARQSPRVNTPVQPRVEARSPINAGSVITKSVNGVQFNLVYCPQGQGVQKAFYMGQTQVTQALWKAVMGDNPSRFKGDSLPVEQVSWFDCVKFCNRLSQAQGLTSAYRIGQGEKPDVE